MISCTGISPTKSASPCTRGLRQNVGVPFPVPDLNWWPWAQSKKVVGTVDGVRLILWYGFSCWEFEVKHLENKTHLVERCEQTHEKHGTSSSFWTCLFSQTLSSSGGDNWTLLEAQQSFVMTWISVSSGSYYWPKLIYQISPARTFYTEEGLEDISLCKKSPPCMRWMLVEWMMHTLQTEGHGYIQVPQTAFWLIVHLHSRTHFPGLYG